MNAREQSIAASGIAKPALAYYIELTKPGIVGLSIVAALTGMFFANKAMLPDFYIITWTFVSLGMAVGGSCMLNHYYDRDIDKLMVRTANRPLAAGRVPAANALIISLVMIFSSLILMATFVNLSAAALTAGAVFGYAILYTMLVKRRTHWANHLGGIAGAMPPVIGYVAVKGGLDVNAVILFVIMVAWQQPHALSLALKYRQEYARAGIPVLPLVKGVSATKKKIAFYSAVLLVAAVLPYVYGMAGMIYLLTALGISSAFLLLSVEFLRSTRDYDMRLFFYSIIYLVVLFTTMVFDAL